MKWHAVGPGAALLVLAIGCGDDGSPSEPTGATSPTTEETLGGATLGDPTMGPATSPGDSSGGPVSTTQADSSGPGSTGPGSGCDYPAGAVEPMALDEVLWPYSWPLAIHGDGTEAELRLQDAPCGLDDVIEWSPHDVLVFISIPAW